MLTADVVGTPSCASYTTGGTEWENDVKTINVEKKGDMTIVICSSDHLTDFVLVKDVPVPIGKSNNYWLFNLPTIEGGWLLGFIILIGLGIIICIFCWLRKRRNDR